MNPPELTRLLVHHEQADPATRDAGRRWYRSAEREARELARELPRGCGTVAAAGILAALSPRAQWSVNVRWARAIAADPSAPVSMRTFRERAARIARGERPGAVLRGPKVRAFWRAIAGDPSAAVVDVWMLRACGLRADRGPTERQYADAAGALTRAAAIAGESVRDFQATVWMQVRGVKPTDPDGFRPA